jgi:hypothetical protein
MEIAFRNDNIGLVRRDALDAVAPAPRTVVRKARDVTATCPA